jgi:hypothetical protein
MINLQPLESYKDSSKKKLYDDAFFWVGKLDTEEMCFFLAWATAKNSLIDPKIVDAYVSDPQMEGKGYGSIDSSYKIEGDEEITIIVDFSFDGIFSEPYSGGYGMPPEGGGEYILRNVKINSAGFYMDGYEKLKINEGMSDIKYGEKIYNLCVEMAVRTIQKKIPCDSDIKIQDFVFPEDLKEKITKIRTELPKDLKRGLSILQKLKLGI